MPSALYRVGIRIMFDRLKSLIERRVKADVPAEPERRFVMPQENGPANASRSPALPSMPRFKGSRTTDGTHTRDIQSRLRMAFGASQPVSDSRYFAGRQETLARIIAALEGEGAHAVIYGERGIGKTSLMHILADTARAARYLVIYDSCGADTRFDVMFRSILSRIPLIYHKDTPPNSSAAEKGSSFESLLPNGPVAAREASDLLTGVTGTRLLIILDEYDRVEDASFRRQTAELIKNLSDRMAAVHILIAGVAEDLDGLIDYIPSIRRNIAAIEVPAMSIDEVQEILRIGSETSGLTFEDGLAERIAHYAGGSPYVARLICLYAASIATADRQTTITLNHINRGAERVIQEWHERMPSAIKRRLEYPRSPAQDDLLLAAAIASDVNHSRFTLNDIREALKAAGINPPADLQQQIEQLDLVQCTEMSDPALYALIDPGLGAYLRLRVRLLQAGTNPAANISKVYAAR